MVVRRQRVNVVAQLLSMCLKFMGTSKIRILQVVQKSGGSSVGQTHTTQIQTGSPNQQPKDITTSLNIDYAPYS